MSKELARPGDEANVLPAQRIGDAQKQRVLDHLAEMHSMGHLTLEEYEARSAYVLQSMVMPQLQAIMHDLPAPMDHRPRWQKARDSYDFSDKKWYIPTLVLMMLVSGLIAIEPSAIAGAGGWWTHTLGLAICLPSIIFGGIGFCWGFCWMIYKIGNEE
jgi:hypothetical protein